MTNAIKFTADSPPPRSITLSVGASIGPPDVQTPSFEYVPMRNPSANIPLTDDWGSGEIIHLHFKVEDTGCGLRPEEKQVLFQRFSQASPRTHAVYGGSGLGLFISRQLAELHGGQVGVASVAGVGSTFGFFIKARRAQSPASSAAEGHPIVDKDTHRVADMKHMVAEAREEIASPRSRTGEKRRPVPATTSSRPTSGLDPSGLHILVVEDNLVNQKVLVKQLLKAGCTVAAANNGVEALVHLAQTEFQMPGGKRLSVILMDLEMPEMDGLTCMRRIREMERDGRVRGHVPTIAVTANVREEQVSEARAAGMDDVLSKPFRIPALLAKMEDLLKGLEGDREGRES
jgi:CheY-like chemotaxis protein